MCQRVRRASQGLVSFVAEAFDGTQNLVCGVGPFERFRISIVQVNEARISASSDRTEV